MSFDKIPTGKNLDKVENQDNFSEQEAEDMEKQGELTADQQKILDENIAFLKEKEESHFGLYGPEVYKKRQEAMRAIYELGSQVLPHLKEDFSKSYPLEYSFFVDALSEEENAEMIVDSISKYSKEFDSEDPRNEEFFMYMTNSVNRILYEWRLNEGDSENLQKREKLAVEITKILDTLEGEGEEFELCKSWLEESLALSMTESTKEYFFKKRDSINRITALYSKDARNYHDDLLARYQFDFQKEKLLENEEGSMENLEVDLEKADRAKKLLEKLPNLQDKLKPVVSLMAYNMLGREDFHQGILKEEDILKKIEKISNAEDDYEDISELPTVGIEVELPIDSVNQSHRELFEFLGIDNYNDIYQIYNKGTRETTEVSAGYSYSPFTQARYLQELSNLGLITLGVDGKMTKDEVYPLDINFGMPFTTQVDDFENFSRYSNGEEKLLYEQSDEMRELYNHQGIKRFCDSMTYAFDSAKRIQDRTLAGQFKFKSTGENLPGDKEIDLRLEYRTGEFKDYPTYRMIAESQNMMAMLQSRLKLEKGIDLNEKEEKLVDLWDNFSQDFDQLMEEYGVPSLNLADKNKQEAIAFLENTEIAKDFRSLINRYSRQTSFLKEKTVFDLDRVALKAGQEQTEESRKKLLRTVKRLQPPKNPEEKMKYKQLIEDLSADPANSKVVEMVKRVGKMRKRDRVKELVGRFLKAA